MDKPDKPETPVTLSSKKKWYWVSLVITIINPILAGLVLGVFFMSEPEFKKEGKIILAIAIIWGIVLGYLQLKLLPVLIKQGLII